MNNLSLHQFISQHKQLLVITGAGVSTASGIPDYRDESGAWKHTRPIQYQEFVNSKSARQRYWTRSAIGWSRFSAAIPSEAHRALAKIESTGKISSLVTQNVDGLHQMAGSRNIINLHGALKQVVCLDCHNPVSRNHVQHFLLENNQQLKGMTSSPAPDGDVQLDQFDFSSISIPKCEYCAGILKPDVVFYGENVPANRVKNCFAALESSDAVLVVGSSLMVYSSFRFIRRAHEMDLPIVILNQGVTRADDLLVNKIEQECGTALSMVAQKLCP